MRPWKIMFSFLYSLKIILGLFFLDEPRVIPILPSSGRCLNGEIVRFSIDLVYGRTIHKSQGCSFSNVYVDVGKAENSKGLLFVAFSRVRSWEGLFLAPFTLERFIMISKWDFVTKREKTIEGLMEMPLKKLDIIERCWTYLNNYYFALWCFKYISIFFSFQWFNSNFYYGYLSSVDNFKI